ncbi:hypothetical protein HRG84_15770 [Flavisolibacter sp. BT320]|nr:hypothetical protein [Flavisolibacter longurius]
MTQKSRKTIYSLLTFSFLCMFYLVNAQGDPGPDPDGIPIDGGLSLVIAAAVGYAAKKGVEKRRRDKKVNDAGESVAEK